jgi:hypothetical protein
LYRRYINVKIQQIRIQGGYMGGGVGEAMAISALIGAGVGGAGAAATGQDPLKGALLGGVGGAVTGGAMGAFGGATTAATTAAEQVAFETAMQEALAAGVAPHVILESTHQKALEFVTLDLASIEKTITVTETELKAYFDQNQAALSNKEERRASHILFNAGKDASAADRAKAKSKADEILTQLRQRPDQFAELAKKHSQDQGSAPNGGDLDFFAKGAMVKPFEDAAFALKKGDISDVVETDFGYHIIRLTAIKPAATRKLEWQHTCFWNSCRTRNAA